MTLTVSSMLKTNLSITLMHKMFWYDYVPIQTFRQTNHFISVGSFESARLFLLSSAVQGGMQGGRAMVVIFP